MDSCRKPNHYLGSYHDLVVKAYSTQYSWHRFDSRFWQKRKWQFVPATRQKKHLNGSTNQDSLCHCSLQAHTGFLKRIKTLGSQDKSQSRGIPNHPTHYDNSKTGVQTYVLKTSAHLVLHKFNVGIFGLLFSNRKIPFFLLQIGKLYKQQSPSWRNNIH